MEITLITRPTKARSTPAFWSRHRKARARSELLAATRRLLLLLAIAYGMAEIIPACISFVSPPIDQQARLSAPIDGSRSDLVAEIVCDHNRSRWEPYACNFQK
jgi:hypothetical protein